MEPRFQGESYEGFTSFQNLRKAKAEIPFPRANFQRPDNRPSRAEQPLLPSPHQRGQDALEPYFSPKSFPGEKSFWLRGEHSSRQEGRNRGLGRAEVQEDLTDSPIRFLF